MINLKTARQVIAAAEAKADEIGQPMNIAVVDAGGNLLSHVRMDGAWLGSIDISLNKAFTARAFDITTVQLSEQPAGPAVLGSELNHGRTDLRGGVPFCGKMVGHRAIGSRRQWQPGSRGRDSRCFCYQG
jgi:uncharacterized protein GlcG (DUF336 family)